MAKKSKIAKNEQRKLVVARWAERRSELKETIRKPSTPDSERAAAQAASTSAFAASGTCPTFCSVAGE